MTDRDQRKRDRGVTRNLFLWGGAIALCLFAAIAIWPLFASRELEPVGVPEQAENQDVSERTTGMRTNSKAGVSRAGRTGSATSLDAAGDDPAGRGREITQTARGTPSLTKEQKAAVRDYLAAHENERQQSADYTISIGAAVPRQASLKDMPDELAQALPDFQGEQYAHIGDQLVLVEKASRRIVAIIPLT